MVRILFLVASILSKNNPTLSDLFWVILFIFYFFNTFDLFFRLNDRTMNTIQQTDSAAEQIQGVEYDENGQLMGMTLKEFSNRLDDKLSAHFDTDIRALRNKLVAEGKIEPLPF
ncbi:hypothetical protein EZS27_010425 [termite gut metagenome]|uniref:Uncharacterized protein n=1 Tax=termite gut metagenome TaxID=433724 RepID=A0A5J4S6V5_9ZZZZ